MALCLALGARPTKLPGVRLPTRDSIQAIDLEIVRLRRADAPVANDNLPSDERVRRSDLLRVGMEEDWVGGRVARCGACEFRDQMPWKHLSERIARR